MGVLIAQRVSITESHVAASASEALDLALWARIDLLIIDLPSIEFDGPVLGRLMSRFQPRWSLATVPDDDGRFLPMMRAANLDGYVSSEHEVARVRDAINCVLSGQKYFPEVVKPKPVMRQVAARGGLSKRQLEVLALIAEGKSNTGIANILNISEGTVKVHAHAILKLVGVNKRTSAAMIYRDQYALHDLFQRRPSF